MTPENFVHWLRGFVSDPGALAPGRCARDAKIIRDMLADVDMSPVPSLRAPEPSPVPAWLDAHPWAAYFEQWANDPRPVMDRGGLGMLPHVPVHGLDCTEEDAQALQQACFRHGLGFTWRHATKVDPARFFPLWNIADLGCAQLRRH